MKKIWPNILEILFQNNYFLTKQNNFFKKTFIKKRLAKHVV